MGRLRPPAQTSALATTSEAPGKAGDRSAFDLRILAKLESIERGQQEQGEVLDDLTRRLLTPDDRRIGMILVRMLGNLFGTEQFATAEVAARALHRDTIGQALFELIGDRLEEKARALGWLLARLEGVRFKGYRLVAAGEDRGVRLWWVSTPSKGATSDTLREGK